MPFRVPTIEEMLDRANKSIGGGGQPFRDPALQPGFRVKTGDELSGYTRETPGQESARLAGEYNRAGSNNPQAYGYSSFSPLRYVQQGFGGLAQGVGEGLVATVGGVTDTLARISDNTIGTDFGSPVNSALMQSERLMQEMGEGNTSWFLRNVAKSATKLLAAAPAGAGGVAANIFLEPAHQSYIRAREAGMSPKVALGYGVAHGATEAAANALIERFVPGASSMALKFVSSAVADDVAKVVLPGVIGALAKSGQVAGSEGLEEGAAFMLGAAIDESFRVATGIAAGKQYSDPMDFAKDLGKSVAMGFAAGGLIGGGLQSMQWVNTQAAINRLAEQAQQPAQTPPNPTTPEAMNAPQQPTPLADPNIPLQPTGPSQPAAIDPGQGNPAVGEPTPDPGWRRFSDPGPSAVTQAVPLNEPLSMPNTNMPSVPVEEPIQQPGDDPYFDRAMVAMDRANPEMTYTHSEVTSKPPEVIAKIAAIEDPSRAAFASAMGVKAKDLPKEFGSKAQRSYAVEVAKKVQAFAQQQAAPEKTGGVFDVMERLMPGAVRNGSLLSVRDVRAQFRNLSKEQFDAGVLRMSREGKISLHKHDQPSALSPQEREQAITDGNGNFYVGMAVRGASGVNPRTDEAADQSDVAADLGPRKPAVTNNLVQDPSDPVARIVNAMTPAIREKVGQIRTLNMRTMAAAMGLANINQLPPEFANPTNIGKAIALAKKMGQSPQTRAPVPSADRQVTFANSKGNQGVRGTPSGQNLAGPAQGVLTTPEKITDLVKTAAESVLRDSKQKIPLNETKGGGNLRGEMNRRVGSVRVDSRMNGPTIFHEMGHAIETGDKVVLSPLVGSKAESELRAIGQAQTRGGGYAARHVMVEGRAEFIRLYVQEGPAFLKDKYPQLFEHFIKTMEDRQPRALLNLTAAAAEYNMYIRKMNAVDRAGSRIAEPKTLADYLKKFLAYEYWRGLWERVNGAFIDIAEVSNRMDKAAREYSKKVMGVELGIPKRLRPDSMLVYLHGLAASHTQMWLDSQPVMWDGTRQGKSLRERLAPLLGKKEWIDAFNRLLLAKRTVALQDPETLDRMNDARVLEFMNNVGLAQVDPRQQGPDPDMRMPNVTIKRIDPRSTGLSLEDARAAMQMLEAEFNGKDGKPNFKEILDDYYEFHDLLLQYAADASPTLKLSVDRIRAVNEDGIPLGDPGAYVPLLREFEDDRLASPTASAASGQIGRRLVGSDRQIKDPLMATVMNLEARLTTIHERVMLETVLAMADTPKIPGLAPFILKLAPGESGKDGLQTFEAVDRAGEIARYQINDQGLVRFLHAMDPVSFASHMMGGRIIDRFIVGPNRVLKNFATAFNPRFAFLTQTIFSIPEMLAIGGSFADPNKAKEATNLLEASIRRTKNHAELMAQMAVNLVAIAAKKSTLDRFIPGQYFQNIIAQLEQARADGVTFENSIRNDESVAWNISRDIAGRTPFQIQKEDGNMALFKWGMTEVPRWIGSAFGVVPEAAAMAVYQAKLRELGLKPGDAKTIEQRMDIAEAVKESTGNYARRGSTMRYLEKLRPYSSAGVVHGMSLLRAIKADPLNVTQVMGYATILGLLAVAKAMEDDEYLEADITQKVKYLHVKHDGKWYLLPQYSEFGLMTHGAAVVALHSLKGQNEDAWRGVVESVKTLGASVLGLSAATGVPVLDEAISQLMNDDIRQGDNIALRAMGLGTRSGSPIVPSYNDKREGDVQPTVVSKRKASEQYTDKTTPLAKGLGAMTGLSPMRIEHAADTITGRQFSNVQKAFGEGDPLKIVAPISRKEGELSAKDKSTEVLYQRLKEANERSNDPRQKESEADREKRLMLESADRARDAWSALQRATKDPVKVKEYAAKKREVSRVAVEQYDKGDSSKSAFAVQERVAKVLLAKEWDQPEEMAELVANGVSALAREKPIKKLDQDEWAKDREQSLEFFRSVGMSKDEVLTLHDQHVAKLEGEKRADKKTSRSSLMLRRRRIESALK